MNGAIARAQNTGKDKIDFEAPLTSLVWITLDPVDRRHLRSRRTGCSAAWPDGLWWKLSTIISCGTLAAALIPEFTKVFTSSHSRHVKEVVAASQEGGASLNILSGMVAGNFSVFWKALTIAVLLFVAYLISHQGLAAFMSHAAVFAFGLVAFGLLGMGPVTIAVDSYGPVTDNAQSIFELSQIETTPGAAQEIEKQFGFKPDFAQGQALPRGQRRRRQHVQGHRQAGADRHRGRRRHDHDVLDHPGAPAALRRDRPGVHARPARAPRAARAADGRRHRLLVHRRLDAGGDHRRLPRGRVHQDATSSSTRPRRRASRTRRRWCRSAPSTRRPACSTSSS